MEVIEYLPELFQRLGSVKGTDNKVQILKDYYSKNERQAKCLRAFLECMYHPDVVFDLPPGTPKYQADDQADDYDLATNNFFKFFDKKFVLYFATKSPKRITNNIQRERVFIQQLETMHEEEAKLLVMLKDKRDTNIKGLTHSIAHKAFPEFVPEKK